MPSTFWPTRTARIQKPMCILWFGRRFSILPVFPKEWSCRVARGPHAERSRSPVRWRQHTPLPLPPRGRPSLGQALKPGNGSPLMFFSSSLFGHSESRSISYDIEDQHFCLQKKAIEVWSCRGFSNSGRRRGCGQGRGQDEEEAGSSHLWLWGGRRGEVRAGRMPWSGFKVGVTVPSASRRKGAWGGSGRLSLGYAESNPGTTVGAVSSETLASLI